MPALDQIHVDILRSHLAAILDWGDAHVTFDQAVEGLAPDRYGAQPEGLPYTPWQLVEHIRIAQADILAFCTDPNYVAPDWPDDYWPKEGSPQSPEAWAESVAAVRADREALKDLILNPQIDLLEQIPHGEGQTYLREILLVADHAAYHIGQLVAVRRLIGTWD